MSIKMLIIILGAGFVTYCTRFPLILATSKGEINPGLKKFMSFIAPAVLTSLIIPAIFIREGNIDISLTNNYIIASVITVITAYFSKNMLLSVIVGICTVAILMFIS
ncbi:AzlD domain-containing protein [Serpentinicella alkaliphila]|uniref:Branched-subunit amino acid transport protein n=1 Tax=Serpentinicella alkaliphila TaxID=1734049 RepID=A0A4R2T1R6_9FIRM|nr:AzlD domain-containing protein [Serpentinicella alkaliphila]QUH25852.1 AzlD domain-containing protein [Serpentinicella alkaliphila]TCP95301.1 branched-subunit amino acid transport protein [Serpentinicella alkaliphila]